MKNLLNPKLIFVINTLPIVVLFVFFAGEFTIFKSLLNDESLYLWTVFGSTLGILGLLNFGYALYLTISKQSVSLWYGLIALLLYIPFLYLYSYHIDKIFPLSIPQWMFPGNSIMVYVGTFLMPTLAYSLFILVYHFTSDAKEHSPLVNFVIALIVPITGYLFSQIVLPFWKPIDDNFELHALLILIIVCTLVFLFFITRAVYVLVTKRGSSWQKYQLIWKIPISILLPFIGLVVNNGCLFCKLESDKLGIFGDFSNYWFYIIAILNGVFICLPNLESKKYRVFLFIARSLTFVYTFYFFLVFLPFLPISVVAVIAFGAGFLMLTPLLLFVLHSKELFKDFIYLKSYFSKRKILTIFFLSCLVLPFLISISYLKDKRVINETLNYLYSPNYSQSYSIDKVALKQTLRTIKQQKDRNDNFIFGTQTPYLSTYFNWLVLDNLTISDSKINAIENVFFGTVSTQGRVDNSKDENVKITNIISKSTFDKKQNAWKSWIDLEITNYSDSNWFSEFATTIDLPEGSWISDYYLYVGNKKEMGILAEKKSALWVFSNIKNENKDPGILYYLNGNKVAVKVFPFAKNEVRKMGIEILHKEPFPFTIDSKTVQLGNNEIANDLVFKANDPVIYLSANQKKSLKQIKRKPYFHFLVDVSLNKKKFSNQFKDRINKLLKSNPMLAKSSQVSFVNTYVKTVSLQDDWKKTYMKQEFEGGFYLDRAIRTVLFKNYKAEKSTYPIFIVVTNNIQEAIFDKDFSEMKFTFPESDFFFNLNKNAELEPHSLVSNPMRQLKNNTTFRFDQKVFEYKVGNHTFYLPQNNEPSIVLKRDIFDIQSNEIKPKNWQSGLLLQGKWYSQILHPETSDKEWLNLIKYSFMSKIMTPVTSYLVVENEAQKKILKKKQQQVLASNKSLDLAEEVQQMSEPNLLILMVLLGITFWLKKERARL
ncbi:MSEP-CTERM sorting domain-containing protein [Flavobacterium polysaccharolyticum]|uniref:MSEP-CTERM sorting domain-containing protein n=1 Tax=Flavobacterium polysaccharolyticum TaxID=3133148 RepID=A0ABU9NSI9_9FLAO